MGSESNGKRALIEWASGTVPNVSRTSNELRFGKHHEPGNPLESVFESVFECPLYATNRAMFVVPPGKTSAMVLKFGIQTVKKAGENE